MVTDGKLTDFQFYLDQHIELDEYRHGVLAGRLLESLRGGDDRLWSAAEQAAIDALRARLPF
ncbi:MAG: hypothetical protein CMJ59_15940 [Planctomycetaceae bacterium]|nr:hypothetical protein [Planctomycetaceae bacterium]